MIGFFSLFKDNQNVVKKDQIMFVHIPDELDNNAIKELLSKKALAFADFFDVNKVYLNFGKENYIEYDYTI